jgi:hypothetical protein
MSIMSHWPTVVLLVLASLVAAKANQVRGDENAAELASLIDRHIEARLESEGLKRVAAADDAEFLRRVFLDLHGRVPSAQQAARFVDDDDPDKRASLVEELLASPRFGEHFGDVWRKNLISPLVNEQRLQTERFSKWMADRFNNNDGWDDIVADLLTATGKIEENPAVTYLIEGRNPLSVTDLTDLSSRYFLGVRLNCVQCHDHPFVDWKHREYWGMAAFFAQIQTPGRPKMVFLAGVRDDPKMTLASLQGGDAIDGFQLQTPTFLGGEEHLPSAAPLRLALAEWTTSPTNPYFARAMVNRMWQHFFGRGIVNPVDDMHAGNAPSHADLLDELSRRFSDSGFDLKHVCRAILTSRTYQQTSRPGENAAAEAALFARMSIKVLTAEQLYDSLETILGPPAKTPGIDTRLGARYEFCRFFASEGDLDPTRYERGIPHLLRMMNSPQFAGRSLTALATRTASPGRSQEEVVEELFLTILSRRPTPMEQQLARDHYQAANTPQTACRELAWTLLLSSEFSLNH